MEPPPSTAAARSGQSPVKYTIRHEIITNMVMTACIFVVWGLLSLLNVSVPKMHVILTLLSVLAMPYWDRTMYTQPSSAKLVAVRLATNFGIFVVGVFLLGPTVAPGINSLVKRLHFLVLIPILISIMTFLAMLRWILFFTMLVADAVLDYFR